MAPRFWEGCNFSAWIRLLARNRFAVHWTHIYIAVIVTFVSMFHSAMRGLQWVIFGRRIRRTVIQHAPIFIVGHWRTGTTLLHELLILDENHSFPTTYQCLVPNHFLLSEKWFTRVMWFLMPSRRPMDNMAAGWDRPQEDEFALCMRGLPSPYLTIAFPNRPPAFPKYLDLEGLTSSELASWKRRFYRFLQELTCKDSRRLVLKSPPHSCRIKVLLDLFPDARFVHITRDPYVMFPSTLNLWKTLYRKHGLQRPTFQGLEEQIFETFVRLYDRLDEGRRHVPPGRYHELRYEDLVRDPVGQIQTLYERLELPGFEQVRPRLEAHAQSTSDYETNRYRLSPETEREITRRWGDVIRRLGYHVRSEPDSEPMHISASGAQ